MVVNSLIGRSGTKAYFDVLYPNTISFIGGTLNLIGGNVYTSLNNNLTISCNSILINNLSTSLNINGLGNLSIALGNIQISARGSLSFIKGQYTYSFPNKTGTIALTSDVPETGILMLQADPQAETELDISNAVYIKLVLLSTDSDNHSDGVLYINALDDEIPSSSRNDVEINVSEKIGIGATIEFGQYEDMGAFVKYDEGIGSSSGITYTWLDYSLNSSHKILLKFNSRTSSTTLNVLYEIIRHN